MNDSDRVERNDKRYGRLSFSKALRIFDFFNHYEMAAVLTLEPTLPVIIGTDHGADWDQPSMDFAAYLELLLAHYAAVRPRSIGSLDQGFDFAPKSLEQVVQSSREGWS
jgi:hypothetical protein